MNDLLHNTLKKHFNLRDFRNGQEEIIESVLKRDNTLTVMPTGGGKSLCYQLPALLIEGTAIVISPLISLMKDQVDYLSELNYPAAYINSSMSYSEINYRLKEAKEGVYKLLYIAPERLNSRAFIREIAEIDVSFLAIDEAHCISEWGHDFRPAYLNIVDIFDHIPRLPIIALTATATRHV